MTQISYLSKFANVRYALIGMNLHSFDNRKKRHDERKSHQSLVQFTTSSVCQ